MSADLDRFDRMLLAAERSTSETAPSRAGWEHPSLVVGDEPRTSSTRVTATPYITSERGSRYVDRMTCPMCGTDREGIEYHGELMSGAKVHTVQAHTAGKRRTERGQPRCLGAGMRVVFEGGIWKGLPS